MSLRLVTKTTAAENDIRNIATFIARENPIAAKQFGEELAERLTLLTEFPKAGHRAHGFETELYVMRISRRFRRYLIIYRLPDDDTLDIVRILHGARDIAADIAQLK